MSSLSPLLNILRLNAVETIYFCSGSRNACLEKELDDNFNVIHHYEERQAAFMALGESVQAQKPVVVCTTSGTAALECLPAIAEAYFSQAKLFLITADRPDRLRGTGAPQTLDQLTPFSSYVASQFDSNLDELKKFEQKRFSNFPVQLNLKIDDASSFYPEEDDDFLIADSDISNELEKFLNAHHPLIIVTHGCSESSTRTLIQIFLENNYIVYLEKTSNLHIDYAAENLIQREKDIDQCIKEGIVDSIIRIGHTPLTRLWRDLDRKYTSLPILHLDPRALQAIGRGKVIAFNDVMLETIIASIKKYPQNDITARSLSFTLCQSRQLSDLIAQFPLSEIAFFYQLNQLIPKGSKVYLGNSMPIRYWQMLPETESETETNGHELYFNRGANGIDGQLATAIGIARSCDEKVFAIIGDLTALYDLASFFQVLPKNLWVIVVNNYGGRIFEQVGHRGNIINQHDLSITSLLGALKNCKAYSNPQDIVLDNHLIELFPALNQTRDFWSAWSKSHV